jgi:hypothetical protein
MQFSILRHSRMVSLSLGAILMIGAGAALAQSNTAADNGGGAPVLLGNNTRQGAPSRTSTGASPADVSPIMIVTPQASGGGGENAFAALMKSVNSNMTVNANAAAAEREKKLAAEAQADAAAAAKEQAKADPNYRRKSEDQDGTVIMHYTEPNDKGATPPHTFHID